MRREVGAERRGLAAVADFFNLGSTLIADYFTEHDGCPRIEIETAKLGQNRAEQVRAIALLLIVSRQVGHYDLGPTKASVVRDECNRHGVLDTNFASTINRLKPLFVVGKNGHQLMFGLKPSGQRRARTVLAAIARA
jgi:hypothetical protein